MKSTVFLDVMPCSPVEVERRFRGTHCLQTGLKSKPSKRGLLAAYVLLVTCLARSSTVKMGILSSFETSVNFYRTARRHMPEDL
jgi:hypothetical protein